VATSTPSAALSYAQLRDLFRGVDPPYALVDLDALAHNAGLTVQRAGDKSIRVASKSVRSVGILRRILELNPRFQGLMTYSGPETLHLLAQGFDNLLLGYPIVDASLHPLAQAVKQGKRIWFMADREEHLRALHTAAQAADTELEVCVDVDGSSQFPGLYFGVRRSSLTEVHLVEEFGKRIRSFPRLRLTALMIYEAQIAGLPDAVPNAGWMNSIKKWLKASSARQIAQRRNQSVQVLRAQGHPLALVNGGGTGSLETTIAEDVVTEITAGSAFYAPGVFDHYEAFHYRPAAGYAVQITRRPADGIYTCAGGGFTSSGAPGWDKAPKPWLPSGGQLLPHEGAGEVQTPIAYTGPEVLNIGDPYYMRHAKAGELCERFLELHLVANGQRLGTTSTYRGDGICSI